jgi:hypothetical protein
MMSVAQLREPRQEVQRHSWTLVLSRKTASGRPVRSEEMNASELMFFFGAPLSHVVRYEDHLRAARAEKLARGAMRSRRSFDLVKEMTGPRPVALSGNLAVDGG